MKKLEQRVFLFFTACLFEAGAAELFVSKTGIDTNSGTFNQPFATIQKAADSAAAGDTINIRGGRYHEAITIDGLLGSETNRIVFQNYNDEAVVIAGTISITNSWTQWSQNSNVWKTTVSEDVWQLFVDDKAMTGARWPNVQKDWMEPDNGDGHNPTPFSFWDQQTTWAKITDSSSWGHLENDDLKFNLSALNKSFEGAILTGFRCLTTGNDIFNALITNHVAGTADLYHTKDPYGESPQETQSASGARYYIEGHINCLDAPGEWFYDKDTGELLVWFHDSGMPAGRFIEGKNQTYGLTLENCEFLDFNGITLFGAAFKLEDTYDTRFKDCKFLYSSYLKKMLGVYKGGAVQSSYSAPFNYTRGGRNPANLSWRNCEFFGNEGISLYLRTGGNQLVENCWFHNSQFGKTIFGAVSDKKGSGTTLRRNTFHTLGVANATKNGPNGLIEYNLAYNFMFHGDFSVYQIPVGAQKTTTVRYNWALNGAGRNGIRFDGDQAGTNCLVHHTVSMNNNRGFRMKGDQHRVYNITALDNGPKSDINLAREKFYGYVHPDHKNDDPLDLQYVTNYPVAGWPTAPGRRGDMPYHGNENSTVRNIAGDVIDNWPLQPSDAVGVWHGNILGKTLFGELRDPLNWDFRPKAGSDLEDMGTNVTGFTEGFAGAAPDLGAYESGCTNYWLPGRIFHQASVPIPLDDTLTARSDADLIWQPGMDALSHNIYLGSAPESLVFQTNQLNNIFTPSGLQTNQTYHWRIDTVKASGTVTGEVWSFTVSDPDNPVTINHPAYFTSVTFGAPAAVADVPYFGTIAAQAVDPDGDEIIFTKLAGPDWLNIETNGVLSGTPLEVDTGGNTWTVQVSDGEGEADEGFLSISVERRLRLSFDVLADAFVDDALPTNNYGDHTLIKLRTPQNDSSTGSTQHGFLKFKVAVPAPLMSAELSVYKTQVLSGGVTLYEVADNSWDESAITWSNRPSMSGALVAGIADGNWMRFDLSEHITNSGTYSFGLVRGPKDSRREFKSKENGTPAYISLEMEGIQTNSYLEWVSATVSNVLEWGYADDPDGNGLNNLFEYSAGNLPDCHFNGDSYSYTYNRRRDAGSRGLTYQLERSDNLVSNVWETIEFSGTTEILNESFETVTQTGSVSALSQEFIRLKVELDE